VLRKHLDRVPGDAEAAKLLASIHQRFGENDQAAACLSRAARIHAKDPHLLYLLGEALLRIDQPAAAQQALERSIAVKPDEPLPYEALARCRLAQSDPQGALDAAQRGLAAAPDHPDSYFGVCNTLARLGRFREAIEVARRGLARGDDPLLLESAIYAMNVCDGIEPSELTDLHRRLGLAVTGGSARPASTFSNTKDPQRPIRLGLLSCDLRLHSVSFFLEGLLRELDRSQITPILYSTTLDHDEVTQRYKTIAQFRDMVHATQDQAVEMVAADSIDILIDLSGWAAPRQMKLMARRLAPIQGTYLGYPNTTGIPAIDFRLVDAVTDPPGSDAQCTESLIRLPRCFIAFTPSPDWPQPALSAALRDPGGVETITFASFNSIVKLSDAAIRVWRRILDAVPTSRLLLKSPRLPESLLAHHQAALVKEGIPADRLTLHPFIDKVADHVALYHHADIALDPFPYNGTTTTCESMWMGVPPVALSGNTHRARVGVSLLTAVGVPELIAASEEEYVRLAVELANDRPRLAALHNTLRPRMAASPLCDARGLARDFESALREFWRRWCTGRSA
jgi:predicted O-linked N-acetylglucosamine transferase (SPINDLY family)